MLITRTEPPLPPTGQLRVHAVPDATVTPFGHGRLRVAWTQPSWFTSGAVYDAEGTLLPASQRIGGLRNDHALAADPAQLPPTTESARQLSGTWLFGGTWFNHFGHFLTESISTLWPDTESVGLLFVPFWFGRDVLPWQRDMLDLTGHRGRLEIIDDQRIEVEHLLVPERPVVANGHVRPEAADVWRRIARAVGEHPDRRTALRRSLVRAVGRGPARRVFLSRSLHNSTVRRGSRAARRVARNEAELDQLMEGLGYAVVHPEQLSLRDQVAAVSRADVVVGAAGSSLHLSVFAPPGSLVVELGDPRGAPEPLTNQEILALGCGHRLGHIPFVRTDRHYDLQAIAETLSVL